jgi:hypothetical protein
VCRAVHRRPQGRIIGHAGAALRSNGIAAPGRRLTSPGAVAAVPRTAEAASSGLAARRDGPHMLSRCRSPRNIVRHAPGGVLSQLCRPPPPSRRSDSTGGAECTADPPDPATSRTVGSVLDLVVGCADRTGDQQLVASSSPREPGKAEALREALLNDDRSVSLDRCSRRQRYSSGSVIGRCRPGARGCERRPAVLPQAHTLVEHLSRLGDRRRTPVSRPGRSRARQMRAERRIDICSSNAVSSLRPCSFIRSPSG